MCPTISFVTLWSISYFYYFARYVLFYVYRNNQTEVIIFWPTQAIVPVEDFPPNRRHIFVLFIEYSPFYIKPISLVKSKAFQMSPQKKKRDPISLPSGLVPRSLFEIICAVILIILLNSKKIKQYLWDERSSTIKGNLVCRFEKCGWWTTGKLAFFQKIL